jgi:hypothetical protein
MALNRDGAWATPEVIRNSGTLAYLPGPTLPGQQDPLLFDRRGVAEPLKLPAGRYSHPRVSPDGKRIVFETDDGN